MKRKAKNFQAQDRTEKIGKDVPSAAQAGSRWAISLKMRMDSTQDPSGA
jgi:hypothetical protein